ncbi:MAG: tetratricopeptide repeat protein [bacterium]|nr:tetratricopeptide repeat protein [bacterium]
MLTLFSIPKPFRGHIGIIQRNAIKSWTLLHPACEITLFGNEKGTTEVAAEFGVRHIPEVLCNEFGTPLVNSAFDMAQNISRHKLVAYINTDIILMSDFMEAIRQIKAGSFLMVGQRWDVELKKRWDFTQPDWEERLRLFISEKGTLHPSTGIDYFVFPKGLFKKLPPFVIGRAGWDNWLLYRARTLGVKVIDATPVVMVVHQNHDYSHIPRGIPGTWEGPESEYNRKLIGCSEKFFAINDAATYILTPNNLLKSPVYLAQQGKFKEAEEKLKEILALRIDKDRYEIFISLGSVYFKQGRQKEAKKKFKKALSLAKTDCEKARSYYNLGSVLKQEGLMEEAKEIFERVINLSPLERKDFIGGAHFHLGCIYRSLGESEGAKREFETCLKLIPDHKMAKEYLEAFKRIDHRQNAEENFKES